MMHNNLKGTFSCRLALRWGLTAGKSVEQAEAVSHSCWSSAEQYTAQLWLAVHPACLTAGPESLLARDSLESPAPQVAADPPASCQYIWGLLWECSKAFCHAG